MEVPEVLKLWLEGLAGAGDGVFVVDGNGFITLWNSELERILEVESSRALGRPCYQVFQGKDMFRNLFCYNCCPVKVMVERELPIQRFDLLVPRAGGAEVRLNITILSLPAGEEKPPLIVHILREITPDREMHRALSLISSHKFPQSS